MQGRVNRRIYGCEYLNLNYYYILHAQIKQQYIISI
nr:MAG TPA: hypothetical protein [Caudoviricetes sp.]